MWGALEGHSACEASGWCAKNHGGSPLAVSSKRRFVTSEGFWVMYWDKEDENHRVRCGRFDLRNVVELRESKDPAATAGNSLDVRISTAEKMSDAKLLTFTFETDAARWRTLWASAVAETSLSSELGAVRDASLARTLDQQFADQAALKASAFTRGSLHSPRVAPGLERLDTPRATPLGQAARRASAPEPAPGEAPPAAIGRGGRRPRARCPSRCFRAGSRALATAARASKKSRSTARRRRRSRRRSRSA